MSPKSYFKDLRELLFLAANFIQPRHPSTWPPTLNAARGFHQISPGSVNLILQSNSVWIRQPHHGRLLGLIFRLASTFSWMGSFLEQSVRRCTIGLLHMAYSPEWSHEDFCLWINMLFINPCVSIRLCDSVCLPRWLAETICDRVLWPNNCCFIVYGCCLYLLWWTGSSLWQFSANALLGERKGLIEMRNIDGNDSMILFYTLSFCALHSSRNQLVA